MRRSHQLHAEVCRFANILLSLGGGRGDRVTVCMPMIPEAAFALLACAPPGSIHSVVIGGFSADALAGRIAGCGGRVVVTASAGRRGGRSIPLKAAVDASIAICGDVERVLVVAAPGMIWI